MIKLNGTLDFLAFKTLANCLAVYDLDLLFKADVTIDLSNITFAEPFGIMGLLIFITHLYEIDGIRSCIVLPNKIDVKNYLLNAALSRINSDYFTCKTSGGNIISWVNYYMRNWSMNFIPITKITSLEDIDPINNTVELWLKENDYSEEESVDIQVLISELCQNVIYHSCSAHGGMVMLQAYTPKIGDKQKRCILSIGDNGIGILQSLKKNPKYESEFNDECYAINFTLNNGPSSIIDGQFRGNGFYNLDRLTTKHEANLYIHSHGGLISHIYKGDPYKKVRAAYNIPPIAGTQICFELTGNV